MNVFVYDQYIATLACPVRSIWFSRSISSSVVARAMAALIVRTLGWGANIETELTHVMCVTQR